MRIAIVFDTHTGITAGAAEKVAEVLRAAGHECTIASVWNAEATSVTRADAFVLGAWTKGWFIIRQHPSEGALTFLEKLTLNGKPTAVFATYKLAIGSTVTQLANAVERAGGRVTGMYKVKGPRVPEGFDGWVKSLGPTS
jgi:menaquinone-dependent protoporphyrinogen IX oxidase